MENFKIGDEVWFFYTDAGRNTWHEEITMIYPHYIELCTGKIVNTNPDKDYVHVYVNGEQTLLEFGYVFFHTYVFKTKQDAIDKMIKSMKEL